MEPNDFEIFNLKKSTIIRLAVSGSQVVGRGKNVKEKKRARYPN